jgi:hypothetical protein
MATKIEKQFEAVRELTMHLRTKVAVLGELADNPEIQEVISIVETLAAVTSAVPVKDVREWQKVPRVMPKTAPELGGLSE